MSDEQLSPEDFKATFRMKGWTGRGLAKRWELSETWVSKIANNPGRGLNWDDAVKGLPNISASKRKPN